MHFALRCFLLYVVGFTISLTLTCKAEEATWETLKTQGAPTARHEAALVAFEGKAYLIGGRRINPVDIFDPATASWSQASRTPLELHHFQAVTVGDAIYLMGAMTGGWPRETPLEKVVVYYPKTDTFKFVHAIPQSRRRGGAGAVYHDGKIYLVGGITNGHWDGYVPWLDSYDPSTGDWEVLADAPHARDHFQAVVSVGKLYAVGGRTSEQKTNRGFSLTVPQVDVFDLERRKWLDHDIPNLPTPRAGNMAIAIDGKVVVGGGESSSQKVAHDEVQAYDPATAKWQQWPSLQRGRHGSGFVRLGEYIYTASGSGNRGGGPELISTERLKVAHAAKPDAIVRWHPIELEFEGAETSENAADNPFTNYRLDVTFSCDDKTETVRGFYAADGDAGNTGADSGNKWKVLFAPRFDGTWTYSARLFHGEDIAINSDVDGQQLPLVDASGTFEVIEPTEVTEDFRTRGFIEASNGYFRFAHSGQAWIKGGCGSPENLLAFEGFDGTYRTLAEAREGEAAAPKDIHRYEPHLKDWRKGDPTWRGGRGKAIVGGVNYLASQGVNSQYFLTMNIGGDGKDVWPYTAPDQLERFDCSKLDQWNILFTHMQHRGIALHIVTQETENEKLLDAGNTGRLRKLYYNELIARFAHHPAIIWDLGEENGPAHFSPDGQNAEQQRAMATYLDAADPYNHPIVLHTHSTPANKDELLPDLLGHKPLDGLAMQIHQPQDVHAEFLKWRKLSAEAGHSWVLSMDEIGKWDTGLVPDSVDPAHNELRKEVLWGSLMAGGVVVEWYFGAHYPHNDLNNEDWRQRKNMWRQTTIARKFFEEHVPFDRMQPADDLTTAENDFCLAADSEFYLVYMKEASENTIHLPKGRYSVHWFDPTHGGPLQLGSVQSVEGGTPALIGKPPRRTSDPTLPPYSSDWAVLIRAKR